MTSLFSTTGLLRLLLLFGSASGLKKPKHHAQHSMESVLDEYDYIVVGGGTSGLVVANRLSEDRRKTVLVVEYGDFANTINVTVPYFTTLDQTPRLYNMTSVPQVHLDGRTSRMRLGSVVGGSSTINGMAWDRGSSIDYDSWEELGNPGWGWKNLLKYFRKSSRFSPPAEEYVEKYGYTWTPESYGHGPIKVGYPSWQWPGAAMQAEAWTEDLDADILRDGADGKNVGLAWIPQNSGGKEATRSSAETAYYQPASHRPNLHLLVRHYGASIKFSGNVTTGVEIASRDGGPSRCISSKNVILAAGAINTPRILQLSGIGPKKLLDSLDIDVVVDSPGVGANFQDHPTFNMIYEFNNKTVPTRDLMDDPQFYDAAWEEYVANKTGPFSHAWGNYISFSSLQDLDPDFEAIADSLAEQEPLDHLPAIYAENPPLVKGFLEQRRVLQSQFRNPEAGILEIVFSGAIVVPVALQKPLSRGTIFINTTNADPSISPLIDFNTAANPVDMHIVMRALTKARQFMAAESVASLEPVEVSPGLTLQDEVEIQTAMRKTFLSPSLDHPVGTAAMMPREWGGVVDTNLRVYGVEGLWVVDASVMPLLPAAHTQATVYAVAEYAADLIKKHSEKA
ncbi:GMC-OxRdtase-N domain-containing protein [Fusarium keratoplasticum]|uniref:GMC-OxRdtase-N domain-containing protein n=1 Tax=Fusarium keratoplasticum TaxID=1328300 RepID=A0ACC0QEJ1_9HYPO|nr:GMC-OxRdtase-N domain-containing protein [Fusarium keratoplasticum]KAI8650772.1 GMC-OxRdtase-N domain-containing protein [Fusarium keratoplasticum]KAI8651566.1 GMC-OxRdtase-N domain-containing protein [Fusarium keratoplasticum]